MNGRTIPMWVAVIDTSEIGSRLRSRSPGASASGWLSPNRVSFVANVLATALSPQRARRPLWGQECPDLRVAHPQQPAHPRCDSQRAAAAGADGIAPDGPPAAVDAQYGAVGGAVEIRSAEAQRGRRRLGEPADGRVVGAEQDRRTAACRVAAQRGDLLAQDLQTRVVVAIDR